MQFTKIDEGTIEISENGVIGYITIVVTEAIEWDNIPSHKDVIFDFKHGVNPSLTLEEMKEIVQEMEKLK